MNLRRAAALLLMAGSVAGFAWLRFRAPPAAVPPRPPLDLSTAASCRACHPDVFAEWEASFHAQAYLDPLVQAPEQTNNFRKVQCLPCHAPAPVLDHGIGKGARVVERMAAREDGIDCLSCHGVQGRIAGTRTLAADVAPCRPVAVPELSQAALCAPCHNQHETVDEWEASSFARAGVDCLDCHMPVVERPRTGGGTRTGRAHVFPGGHDRAFLQRSFEIHAEVQPNGDGGDPRLVVAITNSGAGHNFPSDARHRALDLIVTLIRADGVEVPARDPRLYGMERGTQRRRFRNPYRSEDQRLVNRERYGRENTQIIAGETLSLEVPFDPTEVVRARIELIYKLTPVVRDAEGTLLYERDLTL